MEALALNRSQAEQMIAHARAEAPLEACGLLGGVDGRVLRVFPATNALHSRSRYLIQPEDLLAALIAMEARGWGPDPLAIYHSHPRGPETPSETDVREAQYPDSIYLIIAYPHYLEPSLRGFRIVDGQVSPVELTILDDDHPAGRDSQP